MKMKAYDAMTLAVFVATDSGYTKLSEPSDIPAITINVLEQGMLEVNCAELQLNCQMVMSELCKMQLAADGTEVYDKSCNLLKSLQINAEEQTNDVYNYSFNNIDGEFVIGVEKVVNYISVPTGVGYTQLYKVEGENLKLVDTKIYNTDAGYR